MDDNECGAVGEMTDTGNQSTLRKPATVLINPPQIPHDCAWARARSAAVGIQRLIASAMVWPLIKLLP
jgi:hypothetical protein